VVSGWNWVWIILASPWVCWGLAYVISACLWHSTATVYWLRLQRGTTAEHIGQWIAQLVAVLRVPRWWDLAPRWPVGIELIATEHGVERLVVIPAGMRARVAASLAAALPGARLEDSAQPVHAACRWVNAGEIRLHGQQPVLAVDRSEDTSRHVLASLQPLRSGEVIRVQWLLVGARIPRAVQHPDHGGREDRERFSGTRVEDRRTPHLPTRWFQGDPVLSAVCRVAAASSDRQQARGLVRGVCTALRGQDVPGGRILRRWWLPPAVVAARVASRAIPLMRWPLRISSREIAGLLGLAVGPVMLPGVSLGIAPALPPSPLMPTDGLLIAKSNYPGINLPLYLPREDRLRHVWVAGPTGMGKSTLLANLISYDIHRGDPVIVIDAGGDLVDDVLARIPQTRRDDVIILAPASTGHIVGLNPIHSTGPEDHELAAALVYHVLESIYAESWGPRTADIVRAGLLTLAMTHAPDGQRFTLLELTDLLTSTGFRRLVTSQPLTPALVSFWDWYESLSGGHRTIVTSPVLNKFRPFSLYTPLRLTLGQSNGLDFTEAIRQKRIILVPLRTGVLGAESAALIGSLVMASVWHAILARATIPKDQRHPVWLYLDEFHQIIRLPIDLADMLAQARGFGLGLTLAHQYLDQLTPKIRAAVLSTTRSQIIFQIDATDADELAPRFTPLTRDDLTGLGPHEIALRPCIGGITREPVTGITYPLPPATTDPQGLAQISLHRFGVPHTTIDHLIDTRTSTAPILDRRSNRMITRHTP
jgi:type IV secretion system coupling TraD/TrwB family protein